MVMQGTDMKVAETPAEELDEYGVGDAYARWQQREGVRVIVDFAFEDLSQIELGPWERKGGSGAIINIPNDHLTNDSHVVEIRPGGKSEPEHHMYEEFCYVISGRGATNIWADEDHKQTFEWHAGSPAAIRHVRDALANQGTASSNAMTTHALMWFVLRNVPAGRSRPSQEAWNKTNAPWAAATASSAGVCIPGRSPLDAADSMQTTVKAASSKTTSHAA